MRLVCSWMGHSHVTTTSLEDGRDDSVFPVSRKFAGSYGQIEEICIDSVMGEAHSRRTRFVMILSAVDFVVERRLRW